MEVERFISPKNYIRSSHFEVSVKPLPTPNKFDVLQDSHADGNDNLHEDCIDKSDQGFPSHPPTPPAPPRSLKPPAIYVYGITDKYSFSKSLAAVCQDRPTIKHTSDFIKFQPYSKIDFDKLQTYCVQQKLQFATELRSPERPLKVLLRKLPFDIFEDLTALGYPVIAITQLYGIDKQTRTKLPYHLFMVSLLKQQHSHAIFKQRYVLHYVVEVEPYRG